MAEGPPRVHLVLALASIYLIWGSVYLAIRLVIDEVDPFQAMAQRFVLAGLAFVAYLALRRGWRSLLITRAQVAALVVTGVLLLGLGNGLNAVAQLEGLTSGVVALVVATVPSWVVLIRLLAGDRPSARTLAGVALGFIGLCVMVLLSQSGSGPMPLTGLAIAAAAALSWSVGSFLQGRIGVPRDIVLVSAYQQLVAGGCSAVLALASRETWSADLSLRGWGSMAYLVVVCSLLGFTAYAWLLAHVSLSLTATHAYVNPVVAVFLGWVVLDEPVGLPVLVGGGIVVAAVVLVIDGERRRRPS